MEKAHSLLQRVNKVTVLTGAGISAESGIATYRDKGGLWTKFDPEEYSSIKAFKKDPAKVWQWYNAVRQEMRKAEPNAAHIALANYAQKVQLTVLTQNVDGLHQRAGSKNVIELHGNIWCLRCSRDQECSDRIITDEDISTLPMCGCGKPIRPNVVWFGENLDHQTWRAAEKTVNCDVMIVIGTSALVNPVAELVPMARRRSARIIEVNLEPSGITDLADVSLFGKATEVVPELLAVQADQEAVMYEADMGRAVERGLEKFFAKYPDLKR